jgi:hypothetical protein
MVAQLEKTLYVSLVWLVEGVTLVRENINSGDLTNCWKYALEPTGFDPLVGSDGFDPL